MIVKVYLRDDRTIGMVTVRTVDAEMMVHEVQTKFDHYEPSGHPSYTRDVIVFTQDAVYKEKVKG